MNDEYRRGHYTVTAKRWRQGWELHIEGVGVTQARTLASADRMAREYLALEFDLDEDEFDVTIVPELDAALANEVESTRAELRDAQERQRRAAEHSRKLVQRLKRDGFRGSDVAALMGVSEQRVSQLAK